MERIHFSIRVFSETITVIKQIFRPSRTWELLLLLDGDLQMKENKLGEAEAASTDTFEDSSVDHVLENELGGTKSASISNTAQQIIHLGMSCRWF